MPPTIVTRLAIALDALPLHSTLNNLDVSMGKPTLDATGIKHATRKNAPGMWESEVSVSGFWASATDAAIAQGIAAGALKRLSIGVGPTTPGAVAYSLDVREGPYAQGGRVAELYPFSLRALGQSMPLRGLIAINETHQKPGAGSATLTGSAIQLGAVGATETLHAVVHVQDPAIFNQVDPIIESDDDSGFATPTTALAMTPITFADGTGAYTGSVAGPITDDWFRMLLTVSGVDTVVPYFCLLAIE